VDLNRLRRLAAEVDDEHREAMHTIHDDLLREVVDVDEEARASRRSFLRRLGFGGTALTVGSTALVVAANHAGAQSPTTAGGATTSAGAGTSAGGATTSAGTRQPSSGTSAVATTTTTMPPRQPTTDDIPILVFGQSLELAAVSVYGTAAGTGKLNEDNTAIVESFQNHHLQHGQAYAGLAGKAALNRPNDSLVAAFGPRVSRAPDVRGILQVLFELETVAASTYVAGLGNIRGLNASTTMANIMPIESRHAVVWGEALELDLDEYVPTFEDPDQAATPTDYPLLER
jgi:hypothetical protein